MTEWPLSMSPLVSCLHYCNVKMEFSVVCMYVGRYGMQRMDEGWFEVGRAGTTVPLPVVHTYTT